MSDGGVRILLTHMTKTFLNQASLLYFFFLTLVVYTVAFVVFRTIHRLKAEKKREKGLADQATLAKSKAELKRNKRDQKKKDDAAAIKGTQ